MAYDTVNPLGTSIETAEITDDSVTLAKLAHGTAYKAIGFDASGVPAEIGTGMWTHIETLTCSGDTTKTTTGTIAVFDEYYILINVYRSSGSGADSIGLRINGLTGAVYGQRTITSSNTLAYTTGSTYVPLFTFSGGNDICFVLVGKALASGGLNFIAHASTAATQACALHGYATLGASAVPTSFTIFAASGGEMTGIIEIFGRNTL